MRYKLLIVDDSKTVRVIVRKALENYDCDVFEALNGIEGLAVASWLIPDLILLDVTMPVLDGAGTLVRLKADHKLTAIPVVMLIRTSADAFDAAWRAAGHYLAKPLHEKTVVEKCLSLLELELRTPITNEEKTTLRVE